MENDMQDADKETDENTVVAVTRDGRVYLGKMSKMDMQKSKMFRHKYLARLLMWVGKLDYFFFVRVLRLPYPLDWIRTVRATRLQKRSGIK